MNFHGTGKFCTTVRGINFIRVNLLESYDVPLVLVVLFIMMAGAFVVGMRYGEQGGYIRGVESLEWLGSLNHSCPSYNCEPCVCNPVVNCKVPKLSQIKRIALDVAEEVEYDRENWNCEDKSRELVRRLEDAGWEQFRYVEGLLYQPEQNGWYKHAWVCISGEEMCIEATSGMFIHPDKYQKRYNMERSSDFV